MLSVGRKHKILVVDDEPVVSEAARRMLEYLGHEVQTCENPRQALEQFREQPFDIIFVDYLMPDMKGDELAQEMKRLRPGQPVAMITAYAEVLPEIRSVDVVLSKPFLMQHLKDAIEKLTT